MAHHEMTPDSYTVAGSRVTAMVAVESLVPFNSSDTFSLVLPGANVVTAVTVTPGETFALVIAEMTG